MTRVVSFQNRGLIDPRAWTLFGASAKVGDNPIGFFGTGLKYAIAIWLRLGCNIEVWRGMEKTVFGLRDIQMRDKQFKVVEAFTNHFDEDGPPGHDTIDELPFTSDLGTNWKAWQAFRELWCNALDEGGHVTPSRAEPREGVTTVIVEGHAVTEAWHERENIMLTSTARLVSEGVEIHERRSRHIYFKGVRVLELQKPTRLTYNIVGHGISLTEDRTMLHPFTAAVYVARSILNCPDEHVLRTFLDAPRESYEYDVDMSVGDDGIGPALERLLEQRLKTRALLNPSLQRLWQKMRGVQVEFEEFVLDDAQVVSFNRAVDFCEHMGLKPKEHKVKFAANLEDNLLGMFRVSDETIWITKRCFMLGTKQVAGTLMEEIIHKERGLEDCTRGMQNYLFDLLVSQHERYRGAPL